jgi:hypothetical protein
MKIEHILFLILFVLTIFFVISRYYRATILERFASYCDEYKDCKSCANASGCSWCPKSKVCLNSTLLKSTDKSCNQNNTISSSFRCKSVLDNEELPPDVKFEDQYDFILYKDKIKDRIPPPNAYMSGKVHYSSADIVSNTNNVRNDVNNLHLELPGIISSAVENQIKPMVNGILSQNYYIQGFQNPTSSTCKSIKTCNECADNKQCGWDPRKRQCDVRGPDKTKYITQKQRCVLTPSTLNLMNLLPN